MDRPTKSLVRLTLSIHRALVASALAATASRAADRRLAMRDGLGAPNPSRRTCTAGNLAATKLREDLQHQLTSGCRPS